MIDKKEAITKYKNTVQPMGIFQIRNVSNGKILVESSKNLNGSKNSSFFQLKMGSHRNTSLQKEYSELGEDNFTFEILDSLSPDEENPFRDYTDDLSSLKSMWVEKLQPFGDKGYNFVPVNVKGS